MPKQSFGYDIHTNTMSTEAEIPVSEPVPETELEKTPEKTAKRKRTFTVAESSIGVTGGRYLSRNATQASLKAAKQQFRRVPEDQTEVSFTLREIKPRVKGVKRPTVLIQYHAEKKLREKPLTLTLNGTTVVVKYEFKVRPANPKAAKTADEDAAEGSAEDTVEETTEA